MHGLRCDAVMTRGRGCHAPLEERIDRLGRVEWICRRCEARKAGYCWQCGRRRENSHPLAVFCTACAAASIRKAQAAWLLEPANRAKKARADALYRARAEVAARKREIMESYRENNPGYRKKDAARARQRYQEKKAKDPTYLARRAAQRRARMAAKPELLERERSRQRVKYWANKEEAGGS